MNSEQFSELMGKLEEIRCGLIDIEQPTEEATSTDFTRLRGLFFARLEKKTGWGRNEIKAIFDESVISVVA